MTREGGGRALRHRHTGSWFNPYCESCVAEGRTEDPTVMRAAANPEWILWAHERIRALEAELADVRKWLDATHANQQDLVMERNDAVAELAALRKEAVKGSWRFRAEKAEARVKVLDRKLKVSLIKQHLFKDDPRVSFRTAEMLMRIALDAPCLCIPNGEACLGHQFIRIWYEEKGALRDADPERVREAEAGVVFGAKSTRLRVIGEIRADFRGED